MIDPWGEQRADMRMAQIVSAALQPHLKPGKSIDPHDAMLFPDSAHAVPDDVTDQERVWMMKLSRSGG